MPDHTHGQQESHCNPGLSLKEGSEDSQPFLGETCGFCKGFPPAWDPFSSLLISKSNWVSDQAHPWSSVILMKTHQQLPEICFHEALGLVFIDSAFGFSLAPGTGLCSVWGAGWLSGKALKSGHTPSQRHTQVQAGFISPQTQRHSGVGWRQL